MAEQDRTVPLPERVDYPVEVPGPRSVPPISPAVGTEARVEVTEVRHPAAGTSRDPAGWLGERLRQLGMWINREGSRRDMRAAHEIGVKLERGGDYLERRQLDGVRTDAEHIVKSRPMMSIAAAAVFGYVLGRAVRR